MSFPDGFLGNPGASEHTSGLEMPSIYTGLHGCRVRVAGEVKCQVLQTNEIKNFVPGVIAGAEGIVGSTFTRVTDTPFVFLPDQQRSILSLPIKDEWTFTPDWDLIAGVRYD